MKFKGFTLVEMLAVIAIIGILAAMLSGALVAVNAKVKRAAIAVEIGNLTMALENYKAQYGEYPPDSSSDVASHIKRAFPRSTTTSAPTTIDPSTALVFWLGGVIVDGRPIGFAQNPKEPFNTGTNTPRKPLFYEFKPDQLDGYKYTSKSGGAPFIYFRSKVKNNVGDYSSKTYTGGGDFGTASAYKIKGGVWGAEKKYQIISPGLDGMYSSGSNISSNNVWRSSSSSSESSGNITEGDLDNVTNFSEGTIGDMIE